MHERKVRLNIRLVEILFGSVVAEKFKVIKCCWGERKKMFGDLGGRILLEWVAKSF